MLEQTLPSELPADVLATANTMLLGTPASVVTAPARCAWSAMGPEAVARLLLAGPVGLEVDLVSLEPDADGYTLWLRRSGRDVFSIALDEEVGAATAVVLARLLDLDPLIEDRTLETPGNARRISVRVAGVTGDVLVSMAAGPVGIRVEACRVGGGFAAGAGPLRRCPRCQALEFAPLDTCPRDGSRLVAVLDSPEPGGTVGAYRVARVLGTGGMGAVFEGEHVLLRRRVAIKVMHRSLAGNPIAASAFVREARAAASIRHANVAEVTDFGLMTSGQPFMVMELLAGTTLEERIDASGTLLPKFALAIAREIAKGLAAAHARGVLHNDIKPSNVMLLTAVDGLKLRVKIVDFGAASVGVDIDSSPHGLCGTPEYIAPERVSELPSDARADLYSLGIVLYEMITGAVPFTGETAKAVMLAHVLKAVPPPSSPSGVLPQPVAQLLERALRKNPDERHQSAEEMIAEIDKALAACARGNWRKWLP